MPYDTPNLDGYFARLRGMPKRTSDQVQQAGGELVQAMATDAQRNHPYTNRSGLLEQNTMPTVMRVDDKTVEFGVYVGKAARSPRGYYYPWRVENGWGNRFTFLKPARDRALGATKARIARITPK